MATQRSPKIGTLPWEDEAPAESRLRRLQPVSPSGGRVLPGMPLEMPIDDEEDLPRRRRRFDTPSAPWYRPAGKFGRILLSLGVLIVLGGFATSCILLKNFLEHDPRFRIAGIDSIQATGLSQVSRRDILPVFGADIGRNIFFIHLSDRRKQLEQIPWIERATVMRILPNQIQVVVKERTPVAFVRLGSDIELVDANGVVLSMSPEAMTNHHYSFPVVTGIDPRDPLPSRRARMAVYQRLIGDLDSTGQHLSQQISEIDLTDPEDARVLMPEQGADILAHFGDDQFLERYQRYKAHIAEWRQQYPHLSAVDLRYDNQVVLEMAPAAGGTQTAVNAADGKAVTNGASPATSADPPAAKAAGSKPSPEVPQGAGDPAPGASAKAHVQRAEPHAASHTSQRIARDRKKQAEARHAAWLRSLKDHRAHAGRDSEHTMSQKEDNLIVVLDIGSSTTRVLAADLNEGALRYRGHAAFESAGMRKGMIGDLGPAARVVKAAVEHAERVARANIDECVVGVGGPAHSRHQHQRRLRSGQPHARDYPR